MAPCCRARRRAAVAYHGRCAMNPAASPHLTRLPACPPNCPTACLQVVPIITKLFTSHDRGIRRGLLENIQSFGPSLPDAIVEAQVGALGWLMLC